MTAGASKAGLTITPKPALALSPQPQPAPTARSLPPELVAREGQNWTPMVGQIWKPIDTLAPGFAKLAQGVVAPVPIGWRSLAEADRGHERWTPMLAMRPAARPSAESWAQLAEPR